MKNNKKQGRCPFSPLTLLAALLLIGGMLAIILPVLQWDAEVSAEAGEYEQLRAQHQQAEEREMVEEETQNQHAAPPVSLAEEGSTVQQSENAVGEQAAQVTVDLSACLAQNPDFIAWLRIPGTNVDYPVVQTDDPDDYLNHTFSGKQSVVGTLFSLADADYKAPGRNIAVYGHHLRSSGEKMFTSLMRYKNPDFLRRQPNHCAGQPVPPQRIYDFCGREHEGRRLGAVEDDVFRGRGVHGVCQSGKIGISV